MAERKVALITGANKGLGLEIARQLGKEGITVLLGARDLAKAEKAATELKGEGLDAHALQVDVTNEQQIAALPEKIRSEWGRLDILVNNAGMSDVGQSPSAGLFRSVMETNVTGPYALTEALLPLLQASPEGRIVNQSSMLGSLALMSKGQGGDFMAPGYTASKAALNMLTVVYAQKLKNTNVKVNAAHPGWVKTDMGGPGAQLEVSEGAKTAVRLALLGADGPSGAFFHKDRAMPW